MTRFTAHDKQGFPVILEADREYIEVINDDLTTRKVDGLITVRTGFDAPVRHLEGERFLVIGPVEYEVTCPELIAWAG